jgi:hypothetical protein
MTLPTRLFVARKLVCAVLLATLAAKTSAGALAEGFAIAGELYAASLLGGSLPAQRPPRAEPTIPDALVAPGERRIDRVNAAGVQVYECRAKAGGIDEAGWVFVAPEAELRGARGEGAGWHYAGPHWEAPDGSRIVGTVKARADAPRAGAIPWLLLATRSVGGPGRFAGVTSVQRVDTAGGAAPARTCDASTIGVVERVPYTADYVLLAPVAR